MYIGKSGSHKVDYLGGARYQVSRLGIRKSQFPLNSKGRAG
ncbi:hypothetical protein CPTD_02029 [Corynebacterium pseudotuberculosis]|nr:hypothetical protein CPTC_00998 [Corynebacterium pseudotuberculosis]KEX87275.1 hypothetical protein CPTD_02029 [Corynebacterium pseudotuberculosis]